MAPSGPGALSVFRDLSAALTIKGRGLINHGSELPNNLRYWWFVGDGGTE